MSTYDSLFESNAITLLKGIYDNIGTGVPYKSINVSFTQLSDNSVEYDELSNDSGYSFSIEGLSPGVIEVITDKPDSRGIQVFVSPLTHPADYCSIEVVTASPYVFRLISMNVTGGADARGFGNDGATRVTFEIRMY